MVSDRVCVLPMVISKVLSAMYKKPSINIIPKFNFVVASYLF